LFCYISLFTSHDLYSFLVLVTLNLLFKHERKEKEKEKEKDRENKGIKSTPPKNTFLIGIQFKQIKLKGSFNFFFSPN